MHGVKKVALVAGRSAFPVYASASAPQVGKTVRFVINDVLTSEAQRVKIAQEANGFVREIHAANPDANVVVLGDLNDFSFSKPILTKEEVLVNMVEQLPEREQYTYVYHGNSHILV